MARQFFVSDDQFVEIVKRSRSWRQVLREMGVATTGTGHVRLRAARLGVDTSHFTGQRRWSDDQLKEAIAEATSWNEVAAKLATRAAAEKKRALLIGVDCTHLTRRATPA